MKKYFVLYLLVFSPTYSGFTQEGRSEWDLIWSDEFQADGKPDDTNWRFSGRKTPDWACYCADNDSTGFVEDGKLHLRALVNTSKADIARYQTGCIDTKGRFSFRYGKIEVRAKLSKGKGSWPAIWLMPESPKYGGWPNSGEIDIMEHLNYDSHIYQTIHSTYVDQMDKKENPQYFETPGFKEDDFNIFSLEWYADRLDFFVNGEKTFSYPKLEDAGPEQWPFNQEFYIILDQALGGAWVGEIHEEDLPVEMVVDWVRVYRKKD